MANVALALVVAGTLPMVACNPFGGAGTFQCTLDAECTGAEAGRCEPNGFCSFADPDCGADGRSYGELSPLSGTCVGDEPTVDAGIDAPPDEELTCLGAPGGLAKPCFPAPPTGTLMISGAIDTDTSPQCSTTVTNISACVIAAESIEIAAGTKLSAAGSRPLILAAVGTVTINGTIDVASHRGISLLGASANDAACDAGTPPTTTGSTGGGAAGGSFGGVGGTGGRGAGSATGGIVGVAMTPTALRGGCRAQDGAPGSGAPTTRGIGGDGGGAVYMIAGNAITIGVNGIINASGAGGLSGIISLAGGGGGGSGGLIGLDAPSVINGGTVFANGGSGAEGSGTSNAGQPGNDPSGVAAAVPVMPSSTNGGDGGNGGAGTPGPGGNGGTSNSGGGGGGGVGVIRVFPAQAIGGAVSPPAT